EEQTNLDLMRGKIRPLIQDKESIERDVETKNEQNKFPQEMAKRTVINRAAKAFINTSHDNDDFIRAINNSTESEYENERKDITPEENQEYIEQNANQEPLDFDDE